MTFSVSFDQGRALFTVHREDGWKYDLEGVLSMDLEEGDSEPLYSYRCLTSTSMARSSPMVILLAIADVSDETLQSVKVLRDECPDCHIKLTMN